MTNRTLVDLRLLAWLGLLTVFVGVGIPAVAAAGSSPVAAAPCSQDENCSPRGEQELCSGVSPSGKILYFACSERPSLACASITPEGEIIYFSCHPQTAMKNHKPRREPTD